MKTPVRKRRGGRRKKMKLPEVKINQTKERKEKKKIKKNDIGDKVI